MAQAETATYVLLDAEVLKVAQGDPRRPTALIVRDTQGLSEADMAKHLEEALSSLPQRPSSVSLILPRHAVLIRTLDLPSSDPAELRTLAKFQAVKETPYSVEEIVLDVHVLEKRQDSSLVSLYLVARTAVQRLLTMARKAHVSVAAVRLNTQCYEAALKEHLREIPKEPVMFLGIDHARTHALIYEGGMPVYARSAAVGSRDLQDETGKQKWLGELEATMRAFRRERPGPPIHRVWLEENASLSGTVPTLLQQAGYAKPVLLQMFSVLPSQDLADGMHVSRADILGAFFCPEVFTLNLLPEDFQAGLKAAGRKRSVMQSVVLAACLAALLLVSVAEQMSDMRNHRDQLQEQYRQIGPQAAQLLAKNDQLEMLRAIAAEQGQIAHIVHSLHEVLPDSIGLSALSYQRDQTLVLKGVAKDLSEVFGLVPVLEKSPYLENVTSQYASKRTVYGKEFTDFQIRCAVRASEEKT